jgi:transcriptional regulator with XRE-family HTH domain
MTPFGFKLKSLRKEKKVSITDLAKFLKVSTAYLSMLENGKRGNPADGMVELICAYFDLIWDDAEEIKNLAKISDINIQINTKDLGTNATALTNVLKNNIRWLTNEQLIELTESILRMVQINQK